MDNEINLTSHAKKRLKKRLGLPKSALIKAAQTAFDVGVNHSDTKGSAKRYLTHLFFKNKTATNLRVYGDFVYVFCGLTLVTVHQLPLKYRNKIKLFAHK